MDEEDVIWSLDHAASAVASAGPAAPGGSQGSLPVKDETTSGVATLTSTASSNLFADLNQDTSGKRSIFQTFWKLHCCPNFLFFELETLDWGKLWVLCFFIS